MNDQVTSNQATRPGGNVQSARQGHRLIIGAYRDHLTGGVQLSISKLDDHGNGHGYRLAGPKFSGSGDLLLETELDEYDVAEIRRYLDSVYPSGTGTG